jgi:N-acetylglutamate synthase-like GNAT family acetyltransferase
MKDIAGIRIRNSFKPGDLGSIVYLHGTLYAREHGFDCSFEPYVAIPLSRFVRSQNDREKIWIVEQGRRVRGSVAVVGYSQTQAQLRWLILHPDIRGCGLGGTLVDSALAFCRDSGYSAVFLWTAKLLIPARKLYESRGFVLTDQKRSRIWGVELTEQRYELSL